MDFPNRLTLRVAYVQLIDPNGWMTGEAPGNRNYLAITLGSISLKKTNRVIIIYKASNGLAPKLVTYTSIKSN